MSKGPGTRITETRDRGTRVVNGETVRIEELVWNDIDGRSFDVYLTNDECLTEDGSLDEMPGDEDIAELLAEYHARPKYGFWVCQGCGTVVSEGDPDIIVDHVQRCDRVDGAGNPL